EHILLADGELIAEVAPALLEQGKDLVHALEIPCTAATLDHSQVLLDGERRKHETLLRYPAQSGVRTPPRRQSGDVAAVQREPSSLQAREPHQRQQQRRLAHAVAAEQREAAA